MFSFCSPLFVSSNAIRFPSLEINRIHFQEPVEKEMNHT